VLLTMWVAGNGQNASRCARDKSKRQVCSGRKLVLFLHTHGAVFSLSRNGIRGSKSAMVCYSTRRISGPNQSQKTDVGSWLNSSSGSASARCGAFAVNNPGSMTIRKSFATVATKNKPVVPRKQHEVVESEENKWSGHMDYEPSTSWSCLRRSLTSSDAVSR
jgi:hypothetical protein